MVLDKHISGKKHYAHQQMPHFLLQIDLCDSFHAVVSLGNKTMYSNSSCVKSDVYCLCAHVCFSLPFSKTIFSLCFFFPVDYRVAPVQMSIVCCHFIRVEDDNKSINQKPSSSILSYTTTTHK